MSVKHIFFIFLLISSLFAFEVQKPKIYDEQNISGWVMSEKLDGIRGYWDGNQLYTKKGKKINVPKWFISNFPPFALDGELYTKRDDFEYIQRTVLDKVPSDGWEKITYNIFEVPDSKGDFLHRLTKAKEWFSLHPNKNIRIIEQISCKDEEELNVFLEQIVALKGEGVIVKDPMQTYHTGRSPHILKVKKFQDMEGMVVGYNYDKITNKFKSLILKIENGIKFNLGGGFSDQQKKNPPKIGDNITFKYYGFTKYGKPKFASFLRVRKLE